MVCVIGVFFLVPNIITKRPNGSSRVALSHITRETFIFLEQSFVVRIISRNIVINGSQVHLFSLRCTTLSEVQNCTLSRLIKFEIGRSYEDPLLLWNAS